jgi:uncharacterized protein YmfQ (DUF2313 family)
VPLAGPLAGPLGADVDEALVLAYARVIRDLFPPGRLWNWESGSVLDRFTKACAIELARIHQRAVWLLKELDPTITSQLLPEWEEMLGITPAEGATDAARRAAVVARWVHRQRFRPADFQLALYLVLGFALTTDAVVLEHSRAHAVAVNDSREIFRFFVYRNPGLPGTWDLAEAQRIIDDIQPAHTKGYAIESINLLYEDPRSLFDRDVFGV